MTYIQYPYATLARLGSDLSAVSNRLTDKQRGAEQCDGLGGDGEDRIDAAIGDFRSTWKTSVGKLVEDVSKWGGLSKAIGDMVAQFDAETAAALRPSGAPSQP
jgi:hypothetical protein